MDIPAVNNLFFMSNLMGLYYMCVFVQLLIIIDIFKKCYLC